MHTLKPGDSFYYFDVVGVLGQGYHGAVYEIRHRQTGHSFALKTMHAADCVDPNKTARALAGARGNYQIEHRNVVQVLDLNCEADGLVWMRTELLKGYTLHELVARQGRLSLPFALAVATEAAFGLHAMHEAQIIHRDVKPSNLFYTEGRAVKVIDLSLAKVFPEGLETTVGKRLGLGTPAYSAPEQLEGHMRPDVRFDVYGLGITLWEMLTGKNPFADVLGDLPELLKRQLTVMPPLLADVAKLPPRVDEVVRRAVAKDPAQRYGSMMEMARALMDLSAWVAAEARAGRLTIVVPLGEPPLPGDANTWRDYRPPEPTPAHDAPESAPRARVLVADATPSVRPAPRVLAATVPLTPPSTLARTVELDAAPQAVLGAAPPVRETRAAVTQSGVPARRLAWPAVAVAVAVASAASVALVAWFLARSPTPETAGPATTSVPPASRTAAAASVSVSAGVPASSSATTAPPVPASARPPASATVSRRASPPPLAAPLLPPLPNAPPPPATSHRLFGSEQ